MKWVIPYISLCVDIRIFLYLSISPLLSLSLSLSSLSISFSLSISISLSISPSLSLTLTFSRTFSLSLYLTLSLSLTLSPSLSVSFTFSYVRTIMCLRQLRIKDRASRLEDAEKVIWTVSFNLLIFILFKVIFELSSFFFFSPSFCYVLVPTLLPLLISLPSLYFLYIHLDI